MRRGQVEGATLPPARSDIRSGEGIGLFESGILPGASGERPTRHSAP